MSDPPTEPTAADDTSSHLTESDRHRLLMAEHRRLALSVLERKSMPVQLYDLAVAITSPDENDAPIDQPAERVATTLHHIHLPKMADMDVLEYDPKTRRVEAVSISLPL